MSFNIILPGMQKRLPPIPDLIRLTLKVIYERGRVTDRDIKDVENFIERYYESVLRAKDILRKKYGAAYVDNDTRAVGLKGTPLDETEYWIMWCSQRLVWDEQNTGEVARNKRDILLHGADYKKIYRLPGAVTEKDKAKAMHYLKQAMQDNPEDYK